MYLMLVFAILNHINNQQNSAQNKLLISQQKRTNEYLESLEEFTEKAYPKIETLIDEENGESLSVVIKTSTIRVNPTSKSDSSATILPNQLVDILKEENRWFYIKYFNHQEEIPKTGWIYKGNVKDYK